MPLHWNPGVDLPAWSTTDPVVILARYAWSRLDQRLLAVHYGKLHEADLDLLAARHTNNANAWTAVDAELCPSLGPILDGYRSRLNARPDPLAIRRDAHDRSTAGIDKRRPPPGGHRRRLRVEPSCVCSVSIAVTSRFRQKRLLPVNFHLLETRLRADGAAVWQQALDCDRTLQVALTPAPGDCARQALDHVIGESGRSARWTPWGSPTPCDDSGAWKQRAGARLAAPCAARSRRFRCSRSEVAHKVPGGT